MPDYDTIFTYSYTSGTTGDPKGAMISHGNLLASFGALKLKLYKNPITGPTLIYLPLAHIMGRAGLYSRLINKCPQGLFGGNIMNLFSDMKILKPTNFVAVPRIITKMYEIARNMMEKIGYEKFRDLIEEKIKVLRKSGRV